VYKITGRPLEGRPGIPLTGLNLPLCCACPKLGCRFPTSYVVVALNGNQFVLCKGNSSNNKMLKVYNFKIKSGIGKWSIPPVSTKQTIASHLN
jgi:hypothetical protein